MPPFLKNIGGEGGIRTHGRLLDAQMLSRQRRYDHFGTSPAIFLLYYYTIFFKKIKHKIQKMLA